MDIPFETDGCSGPRALWALWRGRPLFVWGCWLHDVGYWAGGTEHEKKTADALLARRVAASGYPEFSMAMKIAVGVGGGPEHHTPYRWSYGWAFERGRLYTALSEADAAERDRVAREWMVKARQLLSLLSIPETPEMELAPA